MREKTFTIKMTEDEMLRYYANKIVEDGIKQCSEFNTSVNIDEYSDEIDLSKYKNAILQLLYRDERVADVFIDDDSWFNMVFYLDYCPYYSDDYDEVFLKDEKEVLEDFLYFSNNAVSTDGYISIRNLIDRFIDYKDQNYNDEKYNMKNLIKQKIIDSGFVERYIESNNEVYLTLKNKKDFEYLIGKQIKELHKDKEQAEEFE